MADRWRDAQGALLSSVVRYIRPNAVNLAGEIERRVLVALWIVRCVSADQWCGRLLVLVVIGQQRTSGVCAKVFVCVRLVEEERRGQEIGRAHV